MTRRTLILSLLIALAVTAGAAAESGDTSADELIRQGDIDGAIQVYNENAHRVPGAIATFVRGETINVKINDSGTMHVFGVRMDGMKVSNYTTGGFEDWTLTVSTNIKTIEDIAKAEKPHKKAVDAFNSGRIRYETRGVVTTIKYGILNIGLALFGWLL